MTTINISYGGKYSNRRYGIKKDYVIATFPNTAITSEIILGLNNIGWLNA